MRERLGYQRGGGEGDGHSPTGDRDDAMSIMTVTTRITRQYLERKTKSDLAQMYMELLDDREKMNDAVDLAITLLEDGALYTALDRLKPFERPQPTPAQREDQRP
jgi:hypothetical protein